MNRFQWIATSILTVIIVLVATVWMRWGFSGGVRWITPVGYGQTTTLVHTVAPDLLVLTEISEYQGTQIGFWGAELKKPRNLIRSMVVRSKGEDFRVPNKYVNDLANIGNYGRHGVQLSRDTDRVMIKTVPYTDHLEITIAGGDGAGHYRTALRIDTPSSGKSLRVQRRMLHESQF